MIKYSANVIEWVGTSVRDTAIVKIKKNDRNMESVSYIESLFTTGPKKV